MWSEKEQSSLRHLRRQYRKKCVEGAGYSVEHAAKKCVLAGTEVQAIDNC